MTALLNAFYIFPDSSVFTEALIIGFVLALVGAGGYVLFAYSMKDDRMARRISKRPHALTNSSDNPWDVVSGQNDTEQQADSSSKGGVKIAILISILAVLALVVFLIVKRMGI